jgi:hypothetical protein
MTLFSLQVVYSRICLKHNNELRPNKDLKLCNFKPFQETNRMFKYKDEHYLFPTEDYKDEVRR